MRNYKRISYFIIAIIILLLTVLLINYVDDNRKENLKFLEKSIYQENLSIFNTIVATREWSSSYGGVYVDDTELKPNPYLKDNQIFTENHKKLIKINPAWMTRQLSDISAQLNQHSFHIRSLTPKNPLNLAKGFEKEALEHFIEHQEKTYYTKVTEDFSEYKFMGVLRAKDSCQKCHTSKEYKIGDVVGGISVNIPLEIYQKEYLQITKRHNLSHIIIVTISLLFIFILGFLVEFIFAKEKKITSQLKELEKLKNDNENLIKKYKYAVEGSQSGIWDWNLLTNDVTFDKNWKKMLGYEDYELENSLEEWDKRVHPDDKDQAIQDIQDNQAQKTNYYINIHRMKHKNGHWVWIMDRGKSYFNDKGEAIRMVGFHTDISEFKDLELQLFEKEQNLMAAQEIAHIGHWRYNTENKSFVVSDALHKILGYPKDKKIEAYSDFQNLIHEEDKEMYLLQHKHLFQDKTKRTLQYRIRDYNNNKIIHIDEHISCVDDDSSQHYNYIGTMQDITNLKKSEHELKLFKKIIDNSPVSILITDQDGHIVYINDYFTTLTGYSLIDSIGKNPRFLKSGATSRSEYNEMWNTLSQKKTWGGIFKNLTKDKKEFWETAMIIPILDKNDNVTNYLSIKREITKELFLEKELKEKEDLMLAQSKSAAMGEMISMIAHQWRQPITTISMIANNMMADIELESFNEKDAEGIAKELTKQTQYLSKTIEDFRNFFRQDKNTESTPLKNIFEELDSIITASLKNNSIELIMDYNEKIEIKTYKRELLQVLINLIKNAKEALQDVQKEAKYIKITAYEEKDNIILEINDNANGIPPNVLSKIFDAYFTTKEKQNGTGLGLYMSKMIIEKHLNGSVFASNTSEGACFRVTLQKLVE